MDPADRNDAKQSDVHLGHRLKLDRLSCLTEDHRRLTTDQRHWFVVAKFFVDHGKLLHI